MSTTRITITVRQITIDAAANGKREIKILAGPGTGGGTEKANTFRTNAGGGTTDVDITDIHGIKLTLPDKLAELDVIGTAAEGLPNSFPDLDDDCLVLDESSFLPTEADYNNTDKKDFGGTPGVANDPSEKQVFADLVKAYCQIYNSAIPSIAELDKIIEELTKFSTTKDIDYDHNHATNITEDNAKKTIYRQAYLEPEEAHNGTKSQYLATEIVYLYTQRKGGTSLNKDNSINDGTNWDKLDESTNEGKSNIQAITEVATDNQSTGLGGGKYKGFSIIDREKQKREKTLGAEENIKFSVISGGKEEKLEFKPAEHCERENIDNLRKLEVKDSSGNEVAELSIFKDINKVAAKDLFGFQPGDINAAGEFDGNDLKKADS
ncbi:17594_t:CDS:2 [Entrophospora sp. SA101]|nr:17594_t:CDS:2 [Entrophospora sp. SA101]